MSSEVETSLTFFLLTVRDSSASLGMKKTADKIIVALDVPRRKAALDLLRQLGEDISFFKVGLQLYTAEGPAIVREVLASGARVFLDLKLHDIPNTVAATVESAAELGVEMLTVHLSGGETMVRAATNAGKDKLSILGVTVLTSSDDETLHRIGIKSGVSEQVLRLAKLGQNGGVDGFVASAQEVTMLRRQFGAEMKIVVPGIRPPWSEAGDQKRFMTPRQAIDAGADYLVIGRPITAHSNPREAIMKILEELRD